MSELASRLWEARDTKGWSQDEAAAFLGVHQTAYSKWEKSHAPGHRPTVPAAKHERKLAEFIGASVEEVRHLRAEAYRDRDTLEDPLSDIRTEVAELRSQITRLEGQVLLLAQRWPPN